MQNNKTKLEQGKSVSDFSIFFFTMWVIKQGNKQSESQNILIILNIFGDI